MTGLFISFEGGEGSGKTTQIKLLGDALAARGASYITTREPGGCASADSIRELLLTGTSEKWDPVAETLLFQAARVEHVKQVIKPALASGKTVLCDRFLDSTIVYQGLGKGLGIEFIQNLHQLTLGTLKPDITLLFDIDPAIGLKRAKGRGGNEVRFENMQMEFHQKVRSGFLTLAKSEPGRFRVIDASAPQDAVHGAVIKLLEQRLHLSK